MKKVILLMLCSSLVMSSCDTYTGSGAYAGGSIGSILGSAIGGLSGGPRGSDMGTILGSLAEGKFELEELTRFDNRLIETGNHFYWDIFALFYEIIAGLKHVAQRGIHIESIGIDTWGCDFVYVSKTSDSSDNSSVMV